MTSWHLPPLYDLRLAAGALHVDAHLTFISARLLLWWPEVEGTSSTLSSRLGEPAKLLYDFIGTFAQDGVALALIFTRVPFYAYYEQAPRLVEGLTAVIDQTIAGAVLMFMGKVSYAVAMLVIFFRWLEKDR